MAELTPGEQGTLIIVELNKLPHPEDLAEGGFLEDRCCPDCCASCDVLRAALTSGRINDLIRQSPIYGGWAWQKASGDVDEQWLRTAWACGNRLPGHPDGDGGVYPEEPELVEESTTTLQAHP